MLNFFDSVTINLDNIFFSRRKDQYIIESHNLKTIMPVVETYGYAGLVAYVSYARDMIPLRTDDEFYAAKAEIDRLEGDLFFMDDMIWLD